MFQLSLSSLYTKLGRLELKQQKEVLQWLQSHIQQQEAEELKIAVKPGREVVKQQGCYRLELVKCGKQACRCTTGTPHGPYWYKYWREGSKVKCAYIGKYLPDERSNT